MSTENSVRLVLPRRTEKPVSKIGMEVDEGPLRRGESFGSNSSRKLFALGGVAGLLVTYPVAAEVNLNPKNAVVVEGEMPSQNLLEGEVAGVIFETEGAQVVPVEVLNKPETVLVDAEKEKEINQRFSDSFNGEGEYSDEKIIEKSFDATLGYKRDLGFIGKSDYGVSVQAILLATFDFEGKFFLAIMVKDKKNERKATLVEYPLNEKMKAFSAINVDCITGGRHDNEIFKSEEEFVSFLEGELGKMIEVRFYDLDEKDLGSDMYKGSSDEAVDFYLQTVTPRQKTNIDYVAGLLVPPNDKLSVEEEKFVNSLKRGLVVDGVENYKEAIETLKSKKDFPLMSGLSYRKFD